MNLSTHNKITTALPAPIFWYDSSRFPVLLKKVSQETRHPTGRPALLCKVQHAPEAPADQARPPPPAHRPPPPLPRAAAHGPPAAAEGTAPAPGPGGARRGGAGGRSARGADRAAPVARG
eukprot:CAMPEP_0194578694 /NCGR_PEP_ID=MMETSP0292-20121207/13016_1 /TAXON_ID=39354 /ORGANISM="Heterosigma akashiwo, Strain CCMP2393" /LENGTH=119 /DNA_ID=CAMNT_0039431413 /DNA_START=757 /DNA_END=1112 /DNA_ORIENTATION=+